MWLQMRSALFQRNILLVYYICFQFLRDLIQGRSVVGLLHTKCQITALNEIGLIAGKCL
jgi:hypothetical protein